MEWVEISVQADRSSVDDLVNFMGRYCTGGAVVEDRPAGVSQAPAEYVVVKGFLPVWDEETRRKLEIALLLLGRTAPISEPRITVLGAKDWAESWKAFFPPQHIGTRTVIVPSWHEYQPEPGEVIIGLDPGMAFGTGLHATTHLCLIAIERLLRPGMRVLDVGTGSGVLAISAALQGAEYVDALDVDPVSVRVAAENVERNGVADRVRVARGTLGLSPSPEVPRHTESGYDLLLVNILAEVIADMAGDIAEAMAPDAWYAASGIIAERADMVTEALQAAGLTVEERLIEDDWVGLVGQKPVEDAPLKES